LFPKGREGACRPEVLGTASPLFSGCSLRFPCLARSDQVSQATKSDLFSTDEGLAIAGANGPAPIAGAVAEVVEDRRRRARAAFNELRMIAGNAPHFVIDVGRDVAHKGRAGVET